MGYPGKNHKSYQTPKRPFEKTRIESETRLVIEYGLRNKREVWMFAGLVGTPSQPIRPPSQSDPIDTGTSDSTTQSRLRKCRNTRITIAPSEYHAACW